MTHWLPICALFGLVTSGTAAAETGSIPTPPTRWLTDNAKLLSSQTALKVDAHLEAYQRQSGHQVVVWIGNSIGTAPLDDFTVATFKAWRLGRKVENDGVLVVVLAKDRRMAIEVGYGLEGRIPDAIAARIINDVMAPKMRSNDADAAITLGVDALLNAIEGKPFVVNARDAAKQPLSLFQMILFGILGMAFLVLLVTRPALALSLLYVITRRGGQGGGGGFGGGGGRSGGGGARGSW